MYRFRWIDISSACLRAISVGRCRFLCRALIQFQLNQGKMHESVSSLVWLNELRAPYNAKRSPLCQLQPYHTRIVRQRNNYERYEGL